MINVDLIVYVYHF